MERSCSCSRRKRRRWHRAGQPYCRSSRSSTPAGPSSPLVEIAEAVVRAGGRALVLAEPGGRLGAPGDGCRGRADAVSGRRQEPAQDAGQRPRHRAPRARAGRRSHPCQEPGAGLERAAGGAARARAVRDDLPRRLRRDQRGQAPLQRRDGARRRRHRQFRLHGRPDRPALRHLAPAHRRDPSRRRHPPVRSGAHRRPSASRPCGPAGGWTTPPASSCRWRGSRAGRARAC